MTITHLSLPVEQYEEVKRQLRSKRRFFMRFTDGDSATFYKDKSVIMAKKPDGSVRTVMPLSHNDVMTDFTPTSERGLFIRECVANGIPLDVAVTLYDMILK
jgi:hypothetical protein